MSIYFSICNAFVFHEDRIRSQALLLSLFSRRKKQFDKNAKFILTNEAIWDINIKNVNNSSRRFGGGTENIMFETFKNLLVDELQVDEASITLDAELSADLGINSIELADLVMLCEDKFDLSIDDDDIHKFITVGDVVSYLESH